MAESKMKSVLEKEVTCPLCLDVFKEPKKLPCDHVYCKECIKGLALRSLNATISCPECRTLTQLPSNNVNNLPTDFRMNRLIEAFQEMKTGEETDSPGAKEDIRCEAHPAQPLAIYCETCRKVLCRDCVLVTKEHENHEYGFMEDVEEKVRRKLEIRISKIQAREEGISSSLKKIMNADMAINHCEAECQLEIDRAFESLINEIEERKQAIKASTAEQCRLLSSGYAKQKEKLKAAQAELQESITLATTSLNDPVVKFLSSQESTYRKLDHVESKFQQLPLSVSRPQLLMVKVSDTQSQLEKYVTVQQQMDPIQWDLVKSLPKSIPLAHQYTFDIITRADKRFWKKGFQKKNYKFNIVLHCVRDGSEIKGEVKQLSTDRVTIFITPHSRGRHKLSVTLSGVHISNSPFDVFVHNPHPVREIPNLRGAIGLTLIDNKLIATELDRNQILYVDSHFSIVLHGVNGITRDSECNLYATTGASDPQLHKFTRNGIHIKSGGKYGTADGQFLYSNGPRVSKNNEFYVCDSLASRVQVFDLDLNFKRAFGGKDYLNFPADVDFDAAGNVYVTDPWNDRIQAFDSRGHYIRSIGRSHLVRPAGLFIKDELIYTTEHHASRISVLTMSGQLVTTICSGYISEPNGLTVGQDGLVYVTSNKSKIFVF